MDGYCAGCPGGYRVVVLCPVIQSITEPRRMPGSSLVGLCENFNAFFLAADDNCEITTSVAQHCLATVLRHHQ